MNLFFQCVLIIIGVAIGVLVYYGLESHARSFPKVGDKTNMLVVLQVLEVSGVELLDTLATKRISVEAMYPSNIHLKNLGFLFNVSAIAYSV